MDYNLFRYYDAESGNMEVKIVPTKDGGVTYKPAHPGRARNNAKEWDDAVKQVREAMQGVGTRDPAAQ